MSLLEDVEAAMVPHGPKCGVARFLAGLDEPFRTEAAAAIDNTSVEATALSRVLKTRGHRLSDYIINRHRSGKCSCP